jgi:DNA-binding response OmpR family regulator
MLKAKADIDTGLAGLERGADACLTKPIDERELHIQLNNMLELRRRLFKRYTSLEKLPETSDISMKKEDEFMIKVRQILETNLQDDEFGISNLCKELTVRRAQLYRKFRSLIDRTIADYVKPLIA